MTATEKSTGKSITTSIKNDTVNLTNEDIKALREKNKDEKIKKKCGRKTMKENKNKYEHNKYSDDNIRR